MRGKNGKDVFLLYDTCCLYEIVVLNYFMKYSGCDVVFCSLDGRLVRSMEGYSVNVDMALSDLDLDQVRCFVVPGGNIKMVSREAVRKLLRHLKEEGTLIAGICAGVDLLDAAGILKDVASTHSTDEDVVNDHGVITSRANGYVDFAVEVAKELGLFADEADLRETVEFWKYHKLME